jgi:hypothetical protein
MKMSKHWWATLAFGIVIVSLAYVITPEKPLSLILGLILGMIVVTFLDSWWFNAPQE